MPLGEHTYNDSFALRTGYFNEADEKAAASSYPWNWSQIQKSM
jgi:hypothetical protein